MKNLKLLLLSPLLMLSLACSQQWREGDDQTDPDTVILALDAIIDGATAASTSEGQVFKSLYGSQTSSIYFTYSTLDQAETHDAKTPLGMPWNVFAVNDLSLFGQPDKVAKDIRLITVALVDEPSSNQMAMVVDYHVGGDANYTTVFFSTRADNPPRIENEELIIPMSGSLVLKTWDVEDGELKPVAGFRLYKVDSAGNEIFLGKIPTMIGYGG